MTPPPATPVAGPAVCERPHVLVVREDADADRPARTARAAGRADRVLLALRPPGAGVVHRAVRDRARGRAARYRGSVVHRPHRHVGDVGAGRPIREPDVAVARRHGAGGADCPARYRAGALSRHQPGDRRAVHQPDPLAESLARGAAELGVFPKRLRRPHLESRHADGAGVAREPGRLGHRGLVRDRLRHDRPDHDRRRRLVADDPDPVLVRRLYRAARLLRAAHARPLEEDAYVRDAVEFHTGHFLAQQRLITAFGTILAVLNAVLVAGAGAIALALWLRGAVDVGAIAMVLPLTFQLTNMSRWVA